MCKQRSETSRRRLCCEKLSTSDDVKGFAIGSFLERIVVERAKLMMTSVRKTLKTLVWLVQNRSVSSKICPENNHRICCFFIDCFPAKFAPKILAKSCKIGRFFRDFVPKNPAKFDFFFHDLSEGLYGGKEEAWCLSSTYTATSTTTVSMRINCTAMKVVRCSWFLLWWHSRCSRPSASVVMAIMAFTWRRGCWFRRFLSNTKTFSNTF